MKLRAGALLTGAAAVAAAVAVSALAGPTAAPPRKRTPAQIAALVKRAIAHEKKALTFLPGKPDQARDELEKSQSDLRQAEGSSSRIPRFRVAGASLRQAINKDEIALDNLDRPRERGRVRLKINEAIIRKEAALDIYQPPPPAPPPPPPPSLKPIQAEFSEQLKATRYTVELPGATGTITYLWKLTPPPEGDDPNCDNHGDLESTEPDFIWYHSDEDGCKHEGKDHNGIVTVEVRNAGWVCHASITGTLTHPGDPPGPCTKA